MSVQQKRITEKECMKKHKKANNGEWHEKYDFKIRYDCILAIETIIKKTRTKQFFLGFFQLSKKKENIFAC